MNKTFYLAVTLLLIFTGCSSKQYFEPEDSYSFDQDTQELSGTIIDLNRICVYTADGRDGWRDAGERRNGGHREWSRTACARTTWRAAHRMAAWSNCVLR